MIQYYENRYIFRAHKKIAFLTFSQYKAEKKQIAFEDISILSWSWV